MAVTAHIFGQSLFSILNTEIDFLNNTIKAQLCTSAYVVGRDTHRNRSSVTNEVVGTGYTAGGKTLTGKTLNYSAGSHTLTLDCDDIVWTAATFQARYLIFYKDTGTASSSPLISYVDFGADVTSTGGSFTAAIPAAGFATYTAS